ncbi:MAG: 50S ribosomal protein L9 [Patescibacteria group bacterium]
MKIILLKDVPKVGKRFEVKDISDGYALNLLVPKGLATPATPEALKRLDLEKSRTAGEEKVHQELLEKNLAMLEGKKITLTEKGNEKGNLFAGIHKLEIIPAIEKQARVQIDPEHMILEKPIKEAGEHKITVKAGNKSIVFTLDIKIA